MSESDHDALPTVKKRIKRKKSGEIEGILQELGTWGKIRRRTSSGLGVLGSRARLEGRIRLPIISDPYFRVHGG